VQRTATAIVLAVGLILGALGCTSDDDDAPESPSPSVASSPLPSVTATPAWVRPTAEPTPMSALLVEGDGGLTWESYDVDPDEDPGWFYFGTRLFDREAEQFWRLRTEDGEAYALTVSGDHDVALATARGSSGLPTAHTVLLDLQSGRLRALTTFPLRVTSWVGFESLEAGTIRVEIEAGPGPRDDALPPGPYEVDLGAGEIRRLGPAGGRQAAAVPPGSSLPAGSLSLRTLGSDGRSSFVLTEPDGSERVLRDDVAMVWWNPSGTTALLERWNDKGNEQSFTLFDAMSGASREVDVLNYTGSPIWSSDGRYVAMSSWVGQASIYEPGVAANGPLSAIIGPIDGSIFMDWGPGTPPTEALLLADYCEPSYGFHLDRVDLETGETRRIAAPVGGFWVSDWSPDGELIAASSPELPRGFALLDADTGEDVTPQVLAAAVDGMQDVLWSASGRWLLAAPIGGRDRCGV